MQYSGGSPCSDGAKPARRGPAPPPQAHEIETFAKPGDKPDDAPDKAAGARRKSATISFHCDRDPGSTTAAVSFVNTPDDCAYFFEARSVHACAHAEPHKPGSVGPGSVFGIILLVAILVYVVGGVVYNRTVAHARGWRQLPNYSLWATMASFVGVRPPPSPPLRSVRPADGAQDVFAMLLTLCTRCLPGRQGYAALNAGAHGRNRSSDAENRLIDQLDEEWDD